MTAESLPGAEPFADFYTRYHGRLLGFAVDVWGVADADDIAQEAMARALAAYDTLDPARDPWPWLAAVAKNIARDHQRRRRLIAWVDLESDEVASLVEADTPYDAAAGVEQRRLLRSALRNIAPEDRDVLLLRECHDVPFEELSRMYGRSANALRQQAFRARRRLADEFTALGGRALGLAAVTFARVRARAERFAALVVPSGGQVATAALAGGLVLGGAPVAGATPEVVAAQMVRVGAVTRPATVARSRTAAPRAVRRGAASGPAVPPAPVRPRVRVGNEVGGTPGTGDWRHAHRAGVDAGDAGVEESGRGWSDDQRGLLCVLPPTATGCRP
ncbi:MAG: hypothetical protein QOE45_368 [Frankiaceae bacterium]|jgi:RNA polymerase sigma-70 factor (ECF subfamily)|nr:hypothetical protein [Frankiaceae bacterium]